MSLETPDPPSIRWWRCGFCKDLFIITVKEHELGTNWAADDELARQRIAHLVDGHSMEI